MGKIKSKSIRKATKLLSNEGVKFNSNFEEDKKILKGLIISKKLRNQMAGLMSKTKKAEIAKLNSLVK
jgi:ribosomal protein S17E